MTGWPMRTSRWRPERRAIIIAKAYPHEAGPKAMLTHQRETLMTIVAHHLAGEGDHTEWFLSSAAFWSWVQGRGRSVLVVLGHADRDFAMIGPPPHHDLIRPMLAHQSNAPKLFFAQYGRMPRPDGKGYGHRMDVMQIGNLHHEGIYCHELSFHDMYEWMTAWLKMLDDADVPRMEWTIARQSLRSLRRHSHEEPVTRRLWWHDYRELHQFECAAKAAQSPVRLCENGVYSKLYQLDFVAHYLSVLAAHPMPCEYRGCASNARKWRVREFLDGGGAILAEVDLRDGSRSILTTPDFLARYDEIASVQRVIFYRTTTMLQGWAHKAFSLRQSAPDVIRPSVKALGVSLWGRLGQQNWDWQVDDDHEYQPGEEILYGAGDIVDRATGVRERYDAEGNKEVSDPAAWRPERFPALSAHVLAYGRLALEELMATVEPIYCHTDSVWSLVPVPDTYRFPKGEQLGGVKQTIHRDVEFRDGVRIISGITDAAPGQGRPGTRTYFPFDTPAVASQSHTALYRMRD